MIYTDPEQADAKREEVKKELTQEYQLHKEPTSEFIKAFCEKHEVSLPADIFFDASDLCGFYRDGSAITRLSRQSGQGKTCEVHCPPVDPQSAHFSSIRLFSDKVIGGFSKI